MKTNQVMVRPMGCFSVEQRTKDGMFNATGLLNQWNRTVKENMGNPIFKEKAIADFFRLDNTKEFITALMEYLRNQWRKTNVPKVFLKSLPR